MPHRSRRETLQLVFEEGQMAALRGQPLDDCRYRNAEKRNSWIRGWHDITSTNIELTAAEKETGKAHIAELRKLLEGK